MQKSEFVYVTYIRTTPEKLWQALTDPKVTPQYFFGATHESEWKPGAVWRLVSSEGAVIDSGEVVEIDPPKKLVLKWRKEVEPEMHAEGYSRMTYLIEPSGASVKLTVLHEMEKEGSKLIAAVSNGWPHILASLKSLLETGEALEGTNG